MAPDLNKKQDASSPTDLASPESGLAYDKEPEESEILDEISDSFEKKASDQDSEGIEKNPANPLPVSDSGETDITEEAGVGAEAASNQEKADTGSSDKIDFGSGTLPNESADPGLIADKATEATDTDAKENEEPGGKPMGLLDHLNELRSRLTKAVIALAFGFAVCWAFVDPLFNFLFEPLLAVLPEGTHAQYTTLPEAFFTRMYIAFVAGAFLVSPAIFYQIWAFVAPGLYDEEKRYILPIAFCSALFFIAGGVFCYYIVFPFAFRFFISYSTPEIVITPKVSDYLSFTIKLIFAFGLIFEMPIFTLFLARLGLITAAMMRRARKYAIVGIFILAAILTPPDVISQLLMACPMLLLYEVSILVAVIFGRKAKKNLEEAEANE